MNLFLVGFMGSGKSSLAEKMARRLGRNFMDLDQFIEEQEGRSISTIFKDKGESYFRELESRLLKLLTNERELVIALGGGTPCSEENWNFISSNGVSIYIREPAEVLFGRLKKDSASRPLISDLDHDSLRAFIEEKLTEREKFYLRSDFIYEKEKSTWSFLMAQLEAYIK